MGNKIDMDPKYFEHFVNQIAEMIADRVEQQIRDRKPELPDEGDVSFAAKITGYKESYIRQLVHQGEIPYYKRGRRLWFNKDKLEEWLEERQYYK